MKRCFQYIEILEDITTLKKNQTPIKFFIIQAKILYEKRNIKDAIDKLQSGFSRNI